MPSEGSVARGYSVPNFGGVFGMGVKTQTARNDAAPTHHQDCATGRSRPSAAGRVSEKQTFADFAEWRVTDMRFYFSGMPAFRSPAYQVSSAIFTYSGTSE